MLCYNLCNINTIINEYFDNFCDICNNTIFEYLLMRFLRKIFKMKCPSTNKITNRQRHIYYNLYVDTKFSLHIFYNTITYEYLFDKIQTYKYHVKNNLRISKHENNEIPKRTV